jgi:hypothetical protein
MTKILDRTQASIRFQVDDVAPATAPLPVKLAREAVQQTTFLPIEAVSDIARRVVPVNGHGLVATVREAWKDHRPLVLGPDAIWQTIAQGFADHVNANAETLRARLVPHQGKRTLAVRMDGVAGSPENPWGETFEQFATLVRSSSHPDAVEALDVNFSTSGRVERVARAVVLMDAYKEFFEYRVLMGCGIPWVQLDGTSDDWMLLAQRTQRLARYGLDWWWQSLKPVLFELWRTAKGAPNPTFWRAIFKTRDEAGFYGKPSTHVSGWIARFIPYVGDKTKTQNPLVLGKVDEINQRTLPRGFAQAPFKLQRSDTGEETKMLAFAGILGIDQDAATLALRPKIFWAVGKEPTQKILR